MIIDDAGPLRPACSAGPVNGGLCRIALYGAVAAGQSPRRVKDGDSAQARAACRTTVQTRYVALFRFAHPGALATLRSLHPSHPWARMHGLVSWIAGLFHASLLAVEPIVARYGYAAIFVTVALEALGMPVPGESGLIGSAVLAARG